MSLPTNEPADFGGNCGLWGQVHAGVKQDQSLSWPHNAHSRSRDLPRSTGGLPGQPGIGLGSLRGKDTDS